MSEEGSPPNAAVEAVRESPAPGGGEFGEEQVPRVLLVDDDPDILRIVQFYLKKQKYEVFTATNGEEALVALKTHAGIELVLSDVMMPGINGLELLQAIRNSSALSDISPSPKLQTIERMEPSGSEQSQPKSTSKPS